VSLELAMRNQGNCFAHLVLFAVVVVLACALATPGMAQKPAAKPAAPVNCLARGWIKVFQDSVAADSKGIRVKTTSIWFKRTADV
jgi:hypothetical protein